MAFFAVYDQIRPGMLSVAQAFSILIPSAVASGIGSAIILLALPIRYWARIAVSVTGGIVAFFAFGLWQAAVGALLVFLNLLPS
jgi:Zn-dependent protease